MTDNQQEYSTPWERPDVAMIISMFDGRVVDIKATDKVQMELNEGMGSYGRGEV